MTQTLAHPCITLRAVGVKLTVGPAADSSVPGLSRMGIDANMGSSMISPQS